MSKPAILSLAFCLIVSIMVSISPGQQKRKPNIVVIMADDMGYSDIGCYGSEISTPNLDRLAKNGIRFSQFYNTARCCPTRASLLTGLYPHQAGIGHMTQQHTVRANALDVPKSYQGWLNQNCVTIAEVLKPAGYRNYMAGKWHVSTLDKDNWPRARGFDRYFGLINGASNFFKPNPDKHLTLENEPVKSLPDDFYTTDYFTKYALEFLDDHADNHQEKPFFLYLAYTCPHWPLQAWPDDIAKYEGKYATGWDTIRKNRIKKMKRLGLLNDSVKLSERDPQVPEWNKIKPERQQELAQVMAVYAAMIDRMDQNIGKLISKLESQGQLDNTIIFFLADNGACEEGPPLGRWKPGQLGSKEGYADPRYGNCWANVSNTPFKMYKHWIHEGGISSPLIVHWPDGIQNENRSRVTHSHAHLPDLMATAIDLGGASYPKTFNGHEITSPPGKSLRPTFKNLDQEIHPQPIYWEHEGNAAIRHGKWKLVKRYKRPWELYDLEKDRSETSNLIGKHPDLVASMQADWEAWAKKTGVVDWNEFRKAQQKSRQSRKKAKHQ